MTAPRFRYRLAALESLYGFRLEECRLELGRRTQASLEAEAAVAALRETAARISTAWNATAATRGIDPGRHAMAVNHLAALCRKLDEAVVRQEHADSLRDEALAALTRAQARMERILRHKANERRDHDRAFAVRSQNEADAEWIMRRETRA